MIYVEQLVSKTEGNYFEGSSVCKISAETWWPESAELLVLKNSPAPSPSTDHLLYWWSDVEIYYEILTSDSHSTKRKHKPKSTRIVLVKEARKRMDI
jgi:hypothetical protein